MRPVWKDDLATIPRDRIIILRNKKNVVQAARWSYDDQWVDMSGIAVLQESDILGWQELESQNIDVECISNVIINKCVVRAYMAGWMHHAADKFHPPQSYEEYKEL